MLPQDSVACNYFGWGKPFGTLATIWANPTPMWQWECNPLGDNPVEHSRTKHIDIRRHFLRDHQQKGDIKVYHVSTENQLADIFTKPLDEKTFCMLRSELNVLDSRNLDWTITYMCFMPLIMLLHAFTTCVIYLWCSSCTRSPRTSQVLVQMVHIFRGRCATTWPFETNLFVRVHMM
jgi:hypothetical protein